MIKLFIKGHGAVTPLSEIIHAFTNEKIELTNEWENADVVSVFDGEKIFTRVKNLQDENVLLPSKIRNEKQRIGDVAKLGYYNLATKLYDRQMPWGIITGIRPKKLVMEFAEAGELEEFKARFRVSDKKINLSAMTHKAQQTIGSQIAKDSVCVYTFLPHAMPILFFCFVAHEQTKTFD